MPRLFGAFFSARKNKREREGGRGEKVRGRERDGKRERERQNNVSDISLSKDAASKFTFVDLALFVLRDAKLDKA